MYKGTRRMGVVYGSSCRVEKEVNGWGEEVVGPLPSQLPWLGRETTSRFQ